MNEFHRNTWCLLGIQVDVVSFTQAFALITNAAQDGTPCTFSTPNLNFLVESQKDTSFRQSIINSDLNLVDGKPVVWIGRLLGIPGLEKVSGSNLFESLWHNDAQGNSKIKVFFFGGEVGVAQRACQKINEADTHMSCVGCLDPGFGSVDELSGTEFIDSINDSKANFLVIALGAKKGQAWIDRNREKLNIPVVSHLGAVVNFVAGNIKRAPRWMQNAGLEWIWRITQEPKLWQRYYFDGISFLVLFFKKVMPYVVWKNLYACRLVDQPVSCDMNDDEDENINIRIKGSCLHHTIDPLRQIFAEVTTKNKSVKLDLTEVKMVDGAFLGLCLVLLKHVKQADKELAISGLNSNLLRIFRWNCVEYLL